MITVNVMEFTVSLRRGLQSAGERDILTRDHFPRHVPCGTKPNAMSTKPESDLDLDLQFLPAWAQESPSVNRYSHFEGEEPRRREFGSGSGRREPFGRRPDPNRPAGPGGGPRPAGPRPPRRFQGNDRRERRPEPPPRPMPEVRISVLPEENGVDSLSRQIRLNGRAYPVFDIAQLVLKKPDRYFIQFGVKRNEPGEIIQQLWQCLLDDTLWLSEQEIVQHVLHRHFGTFYQTEKTPAEPPKGTYTFVAQCGMSGVILGPPNFHDYQPRLRKLHAERFSRMPFEAFKSRVKIVRDEATVKQWIEDQSWKTEYVCLNVPEPRKLATRDEVEQHFRETHLQNILKEVEEHSLLGKDAFSLPCAPLRDLARQAIEEQRRFPLRVVTILSQQFASRGLQFFKVNKTVTHVSVARPHYLDLETVPVSTSVRSIVDFINSHPRCTRKQLFGALAPTPPATPAPAPVPVEPPTTASAGAEVPSEAGSAQPAKAATPSPASTQAVAEGSGATPGQAALIGDLHWLIHQGHVIEFHTGVLETAKKPLPRPPKPEPRPAAAPKAEAAAGTGPVPNVAPSAGEISPVEGEAIATAAGVETEASDSQVLPGASASEDVSASTAEVDAPHTDPGRLSAGDPQSATSDGPARIEPSDKTESPRA